MIRAAVTLALVLLIPAAAPVPGQGLTVVCGPQGARNPAYSSMTFCWEQFEGLAHESAVRLKEQLSYRSPSANDKYIDEAVLKSPPDGSVFLHIDNVMMRELNNKVFKDKSLSAAAESLWTRILFETMDADVKNGVLHAENPWVVYSDYKTIRLGFRKTSPELEAWMESVFRRASKRFTRDLSEFDYVDGLLRRAGGVAAEPHQWHRGGWNTSPIGASNASRRGRFDAPEPGMVPKLVDGRTAAETSKMARRLESLEELRKRLETSAKQVFEGGTPPFLTRTEFDGAILSGEVLDILRRFEDSGGEQYYADVTVALQKRFGRKFPSTDDPRWARMLNAMREYYAALDTFMPPIYERNEVFDLGFDAAHYGFVSYDLARANAGNQIEYMLAMTKTMQAVKAARAGDKPMTDAEIVDLANGNAHRGQSKASEAFLARRKRFEEAVKKLGVPGKTIISGDENMFIPSRAMTAEERARFAGLLADGAYDDGRAVFVPPEYTGSRTDPIEVARRAAFSNFGEAVEKHLRLELETVGAIPRARLRQIGIAVDLEANDLRKGKVNLILSGTVSDKDKSALEAAVRAMLPEGFTFGSTRTAPPPR